MDELTGGEVVDCDDDVLSRPSPRPARLLDEARARLWRLGVRSLSTRELVALVADEEKPGPVDELLRGGLPGLLHALPEELSGRRGLSALGAARVACVAELSRRLHADKDTRPALRTPADIITFARPLFRGLRREEFHVFCLGARLRLLRHVRVAEGSVDQCQVDPREVLAPAVACRASSLVCVHNHPSGDPEPSTLDVALTRQLQEGARLLCIRVLDHLVLADGGVVSMLQRGLLDGEGPRLVAPTLQSP